MAAPLPSGPVDSRGVPRWVEPAAIFAAAAMSSSAIVLLVAIAMGGCGPRSPATTAGTVAGPSKTGETPIESTAPAAAQTTPSGPAVIPPDARPIKMTLYYLAMQSCPDAPQVPLPKCGGGSIATVSAGFKHQAAMQGSSKLCDGRVVGVQKVNPLCFVVVGDGFPWGITASGRPATPFRSIAVDPKVHPLGHWYYVPELDGLSLPAPHEGKVHDGCVHGDDVGSAVHGDMVDFFVGPKTAVEALKHKLSEATLHMANGDARCAGKSPF